MLYNRNKQKEEQSADLTEPGRLITFEGIDGAGKTTQMLLLSQRLETEGIPVQILREPGGTRIGEVIRDVLLDKTYAEMCMETELLLFEAARAQLVREVIQPDLAAGQWVICDRFYDSTIAYQGYGRALDQTAIRCIHRLAVGSCKPDLTILLDLPVACALARLSKRGHKQDRFDDESIAFMQRTRDGYLSLAKSEPERIVVIDATKPEEDIAEQIYRITREGLGT